MIELAYAYKSCILSYLCHMISTMSEVSRNWFRLLTLILEWDILWYLNFILLAKTTCISLDYLNKYWDCDGLFVMKHQSHFFNWISCSVFNFDCRFNCLSVMLSQVIVCTRWSGSSKTFEWNCTKKNWMELHKKNCFNWTFDSLVIIIESFPQYISYGKAIKVHLLIQHFPPFSFSHFLRINTYVLQWIYISMYKYFFSCLQLFKHTVLT